MISSRTFLKGFSDVKDFILDAEGVTMDNDGNLYVVSEPNLFHAFHKNGEKPNSP